MSKTRQWSFRALAVLLVLSLLTGLSEQGLLTLGSNTVSVYASGENIEGAGNDYIVFNGEAVPDIGTVSGTEIHQEKSDSQQLTSDDDSDKAEGDSDKAGGDADKAGGDADKAGGDADKAGGDADKAGGDSDKAGGDADKAGGDADKAGGDADKAGGDAHKAGDDSDKADGDAGIIIVKRPEADPEASARLYDGEKIHIFNYRQLTQIGSGETLTDGDEKEDTVGSGIVITEQDGKAVTYASDAAYYIEVDIAMPKGRVWDLPDGFKGSFLSGYTKPETSDDEADKSEPTEEELRAKRRAERVYDAKTDTVFIQNIYQLKTLTADRPEDIPVMTGDWDAETFGMGQLIYPGEESLGYLTYSPNHNYVISQVFTNERPEDDSIAIIKGAGVNLRPLASPGSDVVNGRDFFGQVTVTVGGVEYILIGDRQQLDAINYGENNVKVYGPVYKVVQSRESVTSIGNNKWQTDSVELIYPGDADLIDGIIVDGNTVNFGSNVLYDGNNGDGEPYHDLDDDTLHAGTKNRTVYCPVDPVSGEKLIGEESNPIDLKYTTDGKYIVFRDIDMGSDDWKPLMFEGIMKGKKATGEGKLWKDDKSDWNSNISRPIISGAKVVPTTKSGSLNVSEQLGVGFFGTISGKYDFTTSLASTAEVSNLCLNNVTVQNSLTNCKADFSLIDSLTNVVASILGHVIDLLATVVIGNSEIKISDTLSAMLSARASDPSSLATGAFAGRVIGDVIITDCAVTNSSVRTKRTDFEDEGYGQIVGVGGFVGSVQGSFKYDGLSNLLGGATDVLAGALNAIPGLGLGDLVTILLKKGVPLSQIVPVGYNSPQITGCTADNVDLSLANKERRIGYGGFAGSLCGATVDNCAVTNNNAELKIVAEIYGGGFAGVVRDDIIQALLSSLNITVGAWYPQTVITTSTVDVAHLRIQGKDCLGGFTGVLANSILINDSVSENTELRITASGDCISGLVGKAQLGSSSTSKKKGDDEGEWEDDRTMVIYHLAADDGLLDVVRKLLTDALGEGGESEQLLALGGVSQSGIFGCDVDCTLSISTSGNMVGGLVGDGEGVYIAKASKEHLHKMSKYSDEEEGDAVLPDLPSDAWNKKNTLSNLVRIRAKKDFAGGAAGYLKSANASSLLGNTLGLKASEGFRLSDVDLKGIAAGYRVEAENNYAGGVIGFAIGGDVENVNAYSLRSVTANSHAGGFVGTTGPDKILGEKGLNLTLLGFDLLTLSNVLEVTNGIHTNYTDCAVTGVDAGFTVEATGYPEYDDENDYTAGGFAGDTTSVTMLRCKVDKLKSVKADIQCGKAGGFVGYSSAGSLAGVTADERDGHSVLEVNDLVQLEADVLPTYDDCDVTYVKGGYVEANAAGGFTGEFRSGMVNTNIDAPAENKGYAVYNIDHVLGGQYAGGFGGKVYSGALTRDGGSGLSLLGGEVKVDITGLADITEKYVPVIRYAGIQSENGFTVLAAYVEDVEAINPVPSDEGCAGGYIGYGSGMEISYCDVESLRSKTPQTPVDLEEKSGAGYMAFAPGWKTIPYSVAGATYAGGYVGYMNVGCATELGNGLQALSKDLNLSSVLKGLNVVTSTIEHSTVFGLPGGFSVLASSHVTMGDGNYDEAGIGYAGGFTGRMLGAHIQDSHAENFNYVIGEVAAGGYAGEMQPGDVANLLDYKETPGGLTNLLSSVLETDDLLSLGEAFVPTIYNSYTTCIPCGGAVRAQSLATNSQGDNLGEKRGFAGGYVGHAAGAQIWGNDKSPWKDENKEVQNEQDGTTKLVYDGPTHYCDAIRIRSVYGAEYAGGYVGLMENASTASGGNLSLLGGLIKATNLLGALDVVYTTIQYGNVYGPLEKLTYQQWNGWYNYVGKYGGFGNEIGTVANQAALDAILDNYIYGYHVVAGRDVYEPGSNTVLGGCAGGYVGGMHSGVIRYGEANNAKQVRAMRSAGGFAGEMLTKGLAEFGDVNLLGLNLNLGSLVSAANILVPVVFESGVKGYQNGLIVTAEGLPTAGESGSKVNTGCGMAGGYVGACYGGQVGTKQDGRIDFVTDDENNTEAKPLETNNSNVIGAWALNLKTVKGTNCIGGFAGKTSAASVANADSAEASNGLVQGLLDTVISNPSQLVNLLGATITEIGKAEVTAASPAWGIVVDGEYTVEDNGEQVKKYARCAGGFVGSAEATVFGNESDETRTLKITSLRGVSGGEYAGGFFGLANVGSVAEVGSSDSDTNLLDLIDAGDVNVLNLFRTYIYNATVNCEYTGEGENKELQPVGPEDGLRIIANAQSESGRMKAYKLSGCAGGFGGAMMDGTVLRSHVMTLNYTTAPNYSGGFIGFCGSSGGIGTDEIAVTDGDDQNGGDDPENPDDPQGGNLLSGLGLGDLDLNAGLFNVVPSVLTDCSVTGFDNGFMNVTSNIQAAQEGVTAEQDVRGSCAAGFAGYAEMGHFTNCTANKAKILRSTQIAGGFMGRSAMNYLVELNLDSGLPRAVIGLVQGLLGIVDTVDLLNLTNDNTLLGLQLLSRDNILFVNLFGLEIGVSKGAHEVWIGSSRIDLDHLDEENVRVALIEGTRTEADNCSVIGIADGYDVFAGGADEETDGTDALGYAGGFIGYNDAGKISNSFTELCDVIHGTPNEEDQPFKVGPFCGTTDTRSRTLQILEGTNNHYNIYRSDNGDFTEADTSASVKFADADAQKVKINGEDCNRYEVQHLVTADDEDVVRDHAYLKDAVESKGGSAGGGEAGSGASSGTRALQANVSSAKEVLMLNVPLDDNGLGDTPITSDLKDPCDETFELTINKVWRDFIYLGSRPDKIEINVTRVLCDTKPDKLIVFGNAGTKVGETLVLDNTNESTWTTTWQGTVGRFPVGVRQTDGSIKYYQYYINEVNFGDRQYKAYYEADQDSGAVTITNRYTGPLIPATGGEGVMMTYALGLFLLIGGTMMLVLVMTPERKKKLGLEDVVLEPSNFSDFIGKKRK